MPSVALMRSSGGKVLIENPWTARPTMPSLNLVLTIIAIILFVNALWLLFMGGYADRVHSGSLKTYDFASHPWRFSMGVGLTLALAFLCLHIAQPGYLGVLVAKVPQLKILYTVAKMKNGTIYLFAGSMPVFTIIAYVIRQMILSFSTFTKGEELDLNRKTKRAWKEKEEQERLEFERKHGGLSGTFGEDKSASDPNSEH